MFDLLVIVINHFSLLSLFSIPRVHAYTYCISSKRSRGYYLFQLYRNVATIRGWLLFEVQTSRLLFISALPQCGWTIRGWLLFEVRCLFEEILYVHAHTTHLTLHSHTHMYATTHRHLHTYTTHSRTYTQQYTLHTHT